MQPSERMRLATEWPFTPGGEGAKQAMDLNQRREDNRGLDQTLDTTETMVKAFLADEQHQEVMIRQVRKLHDAGENFGMESGKHGYDLGYDDGFHVGALHVLRMSLRLAGVDVPEPSGALACILGLPVPTYKPDDDDHQQ